MCVCVCVCVCVVRIVNSFFFSLLNSNFNTFDYDTYNTHFDESIPIVKLHSDYRFN